MKYSAITPITDFNAFLTSLLKIKINSISV